MHNRITDCAISIIFLIEVGIPVTHGDYISIKMKDYWRETADHKFDSKTEINLQQVWIKVNKST